MEQIMKLKKAALTFVLALTMVAGALPFMTQPAHAADKVKYLDANGEEKSITEYKEVNSETFFDSGWYVVKGDVTLDFVDTDSSDVHLILCDGAKLTIKGNEYIGCFNCDRLTVYAQSTGDSMGSLDVTGNSFNGIKTYNGNITINGGKVTVSGNNGIYTDIGNITINGGKVTASGASGIRAEDGNVTINGGNVTATCSSDAGIYAKKVMISGGTVDARCLGNAHAGIKTPKDGSVEISGGIVNATSAFNSAIDADGDVTISGGEVTAVGEAGPETGGAMGINCNSHGKLTISGGKLTAIGHYESVYVGAIGYASVVNTIAGTGWTDTEGTQGKANIDISTSGQDLKSYKYKKVQFPAVHSHDFTYSADGTTITATCGAEGCDLTDNKTTLTIVKPTLETYGQTGEGISEKATLNGLADFNAATEKEVADTQIKYAGRDGTSYTESTTAPTNAGKYTAKIEVTGVKTSEGADKTVTATVDYEIAKAAPKAGDFTFTAPSELTYNGNQKSATVVPKDGITGMGDVTVKYYSDADCSKEVESPTNAGTYYVGITVAEGTNYSETSSVLHDANWTFTITKATPSKEDFNFSAPSDLTYDGSSKNASVRAKQDITGMGEVTVKYYDSPACEDELVNHINAGTYYVGITVAEGDNYSATTSVLHDASWEFTIDKATPKAGDFTYSAPSDLYYDGSAKSATVVKNEGITGMGDVTVKYYSDAQCSTEVQNPTNVGTYYVGITVTGGDNYSATTSVLHDASWEFTINKGNPIANAPSGLTASYGQKLSDVTLTNPTGNTPGSWSWADSSTSVGSVGEHTFKANFTPEDTANYNSKENVDVAVTVGKAANPATVNGTASVKKGGNELDLQGNVKLNGATGEVSYAISGDTLGCTLSGSKLTSGDTEGSVTVNVTVAADDNYNASEPMPITVTITKKDTQTITAEDVTATYGDTGVKVAATTTGDGQISYAVKDGSGECIGIMKDTGVLTLIKAGTGTVVVTASETSTYAQATKEVTVTINKAASNPAKVTANNRTYDGKKKDLLTVEGEASGGTMMYALGSETAPGAEYSEDIPAAADIGTYYVWYKVVGDENHEDTEPAYVTAKIEARQFTITYDLNGGKLDGGTGKVTRTAKEGEVITLPAPTRDGYTFDYWEGSRYNAGDKYTVTEDHSFKAVWKTADSGKKDGGKSNSGKKGVKTGDENALAAWIVLLMAALTGTGGIVYAKKRRND